MKPAYITNQRAFTLVELIVVTAILGVLALMSIPMLSTYVNKTKSGRCAAEIRTIEQAISAYVIEKNVLPTTLLEAGFTQLDPWERPYVYTVPGTLEFSVGGGVTLNTDFDIYSKGPDGSSDTNSSHAESVDDIVRSNDGGFVGLRAGL